MKREYGLTDEQVELETERLKKSPYVKLAMEEQSLKNKKRKYFYQLRWLEKHGKELAKSGVTMENIREQFAEMERFEKQSLSMKGGADYDGEDS